MSNYNEWIKDKLNDKNKQIILGLKSQIMDNPKYRKEIFAVDVYKAVAESGVTNLEGFREYLASQGKSLS